MRIGEDSEEVANLMPPTMELSLVEKTRLSDARLAYSFVVLQAYPTPQCQSVAAEEKLPLLARTPPTRTSPGAG